jgi:hypothetical protein
MSNLPYMKINELESLRCFLLTLLQDIQNQIYDLDEKNKSDKITNKEMFLK